MTSKGFITYLKIEAKLISKGIPISNILKFLIPKVPIEVYFFNPSNDMPYIGVDLGISTLQTYYLYMKWCKSPFVRRSGPSIGVIKFISYFMKEIKESIQERYYIPKFNKLEFSYARQKELK